MGKWLRMGEAASALGIGKTTVRRMLDRKTLMGRYHSGAWRILRAHVECITAGVMLLEVKRWPE